MPTKKYTVHGKRVPGTTTIIGASLGWGKEGLLYWAWKQGSEGKDFREERDKAANAGTIAHAMVEADVKGLPLPTRTIGDPAIFSLAQAAYEAYKTWKTMSQIRLVASEVSLVSEQLLFGGTIDSVGQIGTEQYLIDVKTSNSTYPDHLIQMAGYSHLWEEGSEFDEKIEIPRKRFKGIHILRFSKVGGDFHHSYYAWERIMDKPWLAFQALRTLYDLKKPIEEMV